VLARQQADDLGRVLAVLPGERVGAVDAALEQPSSEMPSPPFESALLPSIVFCWPFGAESLTSMPSPPFSCVVLSRM
jgi:hypothetical protein